MTGLATGGVEGISTPSFSTARKVFPVSAEVGEWGSAGKCGAKCISGDRRRRARQARPDIPHLHTPKAPLLEQQRRQAEVLPAAIPTHGVPQHRPALATLLTHACSGRLVLSLMLLADRWERLNLVGEPHRGKVAVAD